MDKIFSSKPGRVKFLWTVSIIVVLLLIIRFGVFPIKYIEDSANDVIISFIEKFVTSVITAVIVGLFLYWIQGNEKKMEVIFTKSSGEIEAALSSARNNTKFWFFNGGLGRYARVKTMPELSRIAKNTQNSISLKLIVINPYNLPLLQEYCNLRLTLENSEDVEKWSVVEVQSEIFATVIEGVLLTKNRLLEVNMALKNHFTLTRVDISSNSAVVTRENPDIPSQVYKDDTLLYKHYTEEFNHIYRNSEKLDFPLSNLITDTDNIIKYLLELFPKELPISEELAAKIVYKIQNPKNPF